MERAQQEPLLRLNCILDGGCIVCYMMLKIGHNAYCAACTGTQMENVDCVQQSTKKSYCPEEKSAPHKHQKHI